MLCKRIFGGNEMKKTRRFIALFIMLVLVFSIVTALPVITMAAEDYEDFFDVIENQIVVYSDYIDVPIQMVKQSFFVWALALGDVSDLFANNSAALQYILEDHYTSPDSRIIACGDGLGSESERLDFDAGDLSNDTVYTIFIAASIANDPYSLSEWYINDFRTLHAHYPYLDDSNEKDYDLNNTDDVVFNLNWGLRHLKADEIDLVVEFSDGSYNELDPITDYGFTYSGYNGGSLIIYEEYISSLELGDGDSLEFSYVFYKNIDGSLFLWNESGEKEYLYIDITDSTVRSDLLVTYIGKGKVVDASDIEIEYDSYNVEEGLSLYLNAVPGEGFEFIEWRYLVDNDYVFTSANPILDFNMPGEDLTLMAVFNRIPLKITKGANQKWQKGSNKNVVIECNGVFDEFERLLIDGHVLVKNTDYKVKEGSTIVTFSPSYLEKLSVGDHVVRFEYDFSQINPNEVDSFITTGLKILKADEVAVVTSNPSTGDTTNIFGWIVTLLVALIGLLSMVVLRKRIFGVR